MYKMLLFGALLLIVLNGCRINLKPNNFDSRFATYISGYTPANQSAQAAFRVELANQPSASVLSKLKDSSYCLSLFKTEPQLKGKAWFDGDRSVYFQPQKILDANTPYTVSFNLGVIQSVQRELQHFVFQTQPFHQTLDIVEMNVQSLDDMDNKCYRFKSILQFSDVLDTSLIRKYLSITWKKKSCYFTITPLYNNQYEVTLDSLNRGDQAQPISLSWDMESIPMKIPGEKTIVLKPSSEYSLTSYEVLNNEEQYVQLSFSDPLLFNQNMNGLISLDQQFNQDIALENNVIRIHVKDRLIGSHHITIFRGLKNVSGFNLLRDTVLNLDFGELKPQLRLANTAGSILPNSQGMFMPFDAIGVKAVDVRIIKIFDNNVVQFLQVNDLDGSDELRRVGNIVAEKKIELNKDSLIDLNHWRRYVLNLDQIFNADPASIYRIQIRFRKEYCSTSCGEENVDPVSEIVSEDEDGNEYNASEDESSAFYDDTYESWSDFTNNHSPCDEEYYRGMAICKNILASNIGLMYKKSKSAHIVWTTDLVQAAPKAGVHIQLLDYQNQVIAQGISDAQGQCVLPATKDDLFLIKANDNKQRGYLKIKSSSLQNFSKFDVEGVNGESAVSAFLYAERGVWRPGDSIYLHAIVCSQGKELPEHYPFELEVENPNGQIIYQHTYTERIQHTVPLYFATNSQAITGMYTARVKIGNKTMEKNISIETVKPNRLKIMYPIQDTLFSAWNHYDTLHLFSTWLSGATCKNLKAQITAQYKTATDYFTQFPGYSFQDVNQESSWQTKELMDGSLDSSGNGNTTLVLGSSVKNMARVNLITKVFEPGGDFSIDNTVVYYSPFKHYIGIRVSQADENNFLLTNTYATIQLRSLTAEQHADTASNVRLRVYCFTNAYWWQEDEYGYNDYMSRTTKMGVKDTLISISSSGISVPFMAKRSGRYLFVCEDLHTGQIASQYYYFDNIYWDGEGVRAPEGASQLLLSTTKKNYTCGENVMVHIPNTTAGKALVSIERGNTLLRTEWITTFESSTDYHFISTAEMAPNVYVHVTLLRPHLQTAQRIPLRMYGVLAISIRNPETVLHPIIQCPQEVEPQKPFTITVNEEQHKAMTYSLVVVDEGLLDLTHFKTPDAWSTFYAKQKLQVRTWDMYADVIGAYAGSLKTKLNIGGDGSEEEDSYENKANRFKPVVQCLGVFTLKNGCNRHKVILPSYMGKVRIMLVANNGMAFGSMDKSIVVQQPLMILSTLPRVLMTSNSITMPLTVFANKPSVKRVQLQVKTDGLIQCGSFYQEIQFNHIGDQIIQIPLQVAKKVGIAHLTINAVAGTHRSSEDIAIEVKSPNPITGVYHAYSLSDHASANLVFQPKGCEGSYHAFVTLSTIPDVGLEKKLNYLIQYPHGCVEQTTSAAFPQLYIPELLDVNDSLQQQCKKHVEAAIQKLSYYQTAEGSFTYWPGTSTVSWYATCYVADFLSEAESKGFTVSPYIKDRLLSSLQNQSNSVVDMDETEMAYLLYDLSKWKKPNLGAMNRMKEVGLKQDLARVYLAKAYASCGQMATARLLMAPIIWADRNYNCAFFQSEMTNRVEWIELLLRVQDPRAESEIKNLVVKYQQSVDLNTKECSGMLKVLSMFYAKQANQPIQIQYVLQGKTYTLTSTQKVVRINTNGSSIRIDNHGGPLFVQTSERYIPEQQEPLQPSSGLHMTLNYTDLQGKPMDISSIKQGTDFQIEATITNDQKRDANYLVYRYMLPSGWQFVKMESDETNASMEYARTNDYIYFRYFNLPMGSTKKIRLRVNATYTGIYALPRARVEGMYQLQVNAEQGGGTTRVYSSLL